MFEFEQKPDETGPEIGNEKDNESNEWQAADGLANQVDAVTATINGEQVEVGIDQMLTPMIQSAFGILAPAWQVSSDECAALGKAWGDVAEIWFPDAQLPPKYAVLVTAVVTTGMVVAPRLQAKTPRKIEEKPVNQGE